MKHGRRISDILQIGVMNMITQLLTEPMFLLNFNFLNTDSGVKIRV
ncbi:MAG TPA: hypothetical protein VLA74_07005 [Nitrososphaeraceae archaeon]|nr:hypothetical protein [Nitrososphaeraceae archaeon]